MVYDPIWEKVFRNQDWGKYPPEELIRFMAKYYYSVKDRSKINVLEVGCGTGPNLWYLAREGFTVHGIDGSEYGIKLCRERLDSEVPGWKGSLVVGDITRLEFREGIFDIVIDNEVIYSNSFEDSIQIYNEINRVLNQNGRLFSKTFAVGSHGYGTGKKLGHNAFECEVGGISGKGYSRFTSQDEIKTLLGNRFEIESVEISQHSINNQTDMIKEWIIIANKSYR